ncbi:hypothetical protein WKH57_24945 [Niallia taxi]|uniref:hypothetical protein n=1 Tax=Niallia taxi TaxID=2499688 RepID=UPI00203C9ED7|nr:hypothetical protein [Niallia taxi]MCM3216795.1 hypothetical protein [Niallia taxi]
MLWFGLKKKIKTLENRIHYLLSDNNNEDKNGEEFTRYIQETLLIGTDEEVLELIDLFSEIKNKNISAYFAVHSHLRNIDEITLVGSIARLKGLEEETNSSVHISPIVTTLAAFVTTYIAFNQLAKSIFIAITIMLCVVGIFKIIVDLSKRNRKVRKRVVFFRSLLEHQLNVKKTI